MIFREIKLEVIAIRLKQKRKEAELSMDGLAEKSGLNKLTIFNLENCKITDPKLLTISKLAKALDCTIEELLY